jgi:hypothetical protein
VMDRGRGDRSGGTRTRVMMVVIVGMVVSAVVTVSMIVAVVMSAVVVMRVALAVMVVVAGFAVRMIVGTDARFLIAIDEVESTEEDEPDPREEGIDAEIWVEVFFDPAAGVVIKEQDAPGHQGDDREEIEELFHGRCSDGGGLRDGSRGS